MNNRHLFRAWIKSLKWLVPVEQISFKYKVIEVDLSGGFGDTAEYEFSEVELMQCTGLAAAKSYRGESEEDRLIFEGDILKGESVNGVIMPFVVKWSKFRGYIIGDSPNEIYDIAPSRFLNMEIIGNIYDNSELLEVGNDGENQNWYHRAY